MMDLRERHSVSSWGNNIFPTANKAGKYVSEVFVALFFCTKYTTPATPQNLWMCIERSYKKRVLIKLLPSG